MLALDYANGAHTSTNRSAMSSNCASENFRNSLDTL